MFTPEERDRVRERVFELAREDERVTGGAVTGSLATGNGDAWSDIDTAFGFAEGADRDEIMRDWTEALEKELDIAHVFDLPHGLTLYRVLLLSNALEVDFSLTPAAQFGARGPTFKLEFGESVELSEAEAPDANLMIGFGWIYVLDTWKVVKRGKLWQAVHYLASARDQSLALACLRHGLPHSYGRGVDRLPSELTEAWKATLVRSLDRDELLRVRKVTADLFLREVAEHDGALAERLREPLSA
jgi:predicted nucleotidyltransferase